MDYETLIQHKSLWVEEKTSFAGVLKNLTDEESLFFEAL